MRTFSGETNVVHDTELTAELRAYFSATGARLGEDVWLCVDARWVGDGAPLQVTLYRDADDGAREVVQELAGTITSGAWEQRWRVALPRGRLDELHGAIELRFEVVTDAHPLPVRSQQLLVHRTRFSS